MSGYIDNRTSHWVLQWWAASQKFGDSAESNSRVAISSLSITSAKVVGSYLSKYISYNIQVGASSTDVVSRRFNDFRWLRDTLSATYVGLYIPALPTDRMHLPRTHSSDKTNPRSDFVLHRMVQLDLFLQQLLAIPFVRTHPSWSIFFSASATSANISKRSGGQASESRTLGAVSETANRGPEAEILPSAPVVPGSTSCATSTGGAPPQTGPQRDQGSAISHHRRSVVANRSSVFNVGLEVWSMLCDAGVSDSGLFAAATSEGTISSKDNSSRNAGNTHACNLEKPIAAFKEQLSALLDQLVNLETLWRKATERAVKSQDTYMALAAQLERWRGLEGVELNLRRADTNEVNRVEREEADASEAGTKGLSATSTTGAKGRDSTQGGSRGDTPHPEHASSSAISPALQALTQGGRSWAKHTAVLPNLFARVLLCFVQFQIEQTVGMLKHIAIHSARYASLQKAEKGVLLATSAYEKAATRESLQTVRAAASVSSAIAGRGSEGADGALLHSPSRMSSSANRLRMSFSLFGASSSAAGLGLAAQNKRAAVEALRAEVLLSTKAFLFCEIQRFHRDREILIARLLASTSAVLSQMLQSASTECAAITELGRVDPSSYLHMYHQLLPKNGGPDDDIGDVDDADAAADATAVDGDTDKEEESVERARSGVDGDGDREAEAQPQGRDQFSGHDTIAGTTPLPTGPSASVHAGTTSVTGAAHTRECLLCLRRTPHTQGIECCSAPNPGSGQHQLTGFMTARHFVCDDCFDSRCMAYQLSAEYKDKLVEHKCAIVCLHCEQKSQSVYTPFKLSEVARHCSEQSLERFTSFCAKAREMEIESRAREYAAALITAEKDRIFEESMCVICYEQQSDAVLIHKDTSHVCCCHRCAINVYNSRGSCPICRLHIDSVVKHFPT